MTFVVKFLMSTLVAALASVGIWIGFSIALTVALIIILAPMMDVGVVGKYIAFLIGSLSVAVWTGFRSYRIYKTLPLNARNYSVGDAAYGGAVALVFMSTIGSLGSEGMDFIARSDATDFLTRFVGWGTLAGAAVVVLLGVDTVNRRPPETKLQLRIDLLQKEVEQLKHDLQLKSLRLPADELWPRSSQKEKL